jgi:hypothetical protein
MGFMRRKGGQRGGATTEAVIATPAFVALVFTAVELIVISWKLLSLQMIANQVAREYSVWTGCSGNGSWTSCPNFKFSSVRAPQDMVLADAKSRIIGQIGSKYALSMNTSNTTVAVRSLLPNQAENACGELRDVPGSEDGRGELFELTVTLRNDILGLGLFRFDLQGRSTAVMEPYDR